MTDAAPLVAEGDMVVFFRNVVCTAGTLAAIQARRLAVLLTGVRVNRNMRESQRQIGRAWPSGLVLVLSEVLRR